MNWNTINNLRETGRSYCGMLYSCDYAKKYKNMADEHCSCRGKVGIAEQIYLKRGENGELLYLVAGRDKSMPHDREFTTQFGLFHSDDRGEFGGDMTTPSGKKVGGNFRYVFDFKDKAYAVSTGSHIAIAHTEVYRFDNASDYECVYKTIDFLSATDENKISENLYCSAVDVTGDKAYLLLTGVIAKFEENGNRSHWNELRLLELCDGTAKEVLTLTGDTPSWAKSVLVEGNTLYFSADKMVYIVDLTTKEVKYLTCISVEDEEELLRENKNE